MGHSKNWYMEMCDEEQVVIPLSGKEQDWFLCEQISRREREKEEIERKTREFERIEANRVMMQNEALEAEKEREANRKFQAERKRQKEYIVFKANQPIHKRA